ncbi:uncharacterized protein LOC112572435 [Pomacea canaliculata]|uniref:uncharacterized protein LOC112572435 n=1 Tax=Pomacea canaliculata TaxID=400727 RepID=UPI000D731A02|nr:uncharacterized protein LOC112572435 [Pomacea canaliculata]
MADATKIKDCQILGSYESLTPVLNGRKGGSGWQPYVRDGDLLAKRYFQVYFANKVMVYEVEVEQKAPTRTTRLKLSYSDDGVSFVDGSEIPLDGLDTTRVSVPLPRESRVLRVYALADNNTMQAPSLTFEFYGCVTSADRTGDACLTAPTNAATNSLYYRRSFLAASTSVFVCDGIVEAKGVQQRCFSSPDGTVWQPLDMRLGSMVGFESAGSRVFALANDGVTYMSSGDNGQTWSTSHPQDVQKGSLAWHLRKSRQRTLEGTLVPASYQQGNWGAAFDGLKQNSNTRVKWNCC